VVFVLGWCGQLLAQCPTALKVTPVLAGDNLVACRALAVQLEPCVQWQDSLALVYHTLGVKYNGVDLDSAILYTRKALDLRTRLSPKTPTIGRGRSAFNLGFFLSEQGFYDRAIPLFEQSVTIYRQLGEEGFLRGSYGQLVDAYSRVGDYQKAQTIADLAILADQKKGDQQRLAGSLLTQGLLLLKQKKYQPALAVLQESDRLYQQYPPSLNWAGTMQNLAIVYDDGLHDKPAAEKQYLRAIALYRQLGECKELANTYNNLGVFYVENEQLPLALTTLKAGLATARRCAMPVEEAQNQDHFGEYFLQKGEPRQAVQAFQHAQQLLVPGYVPVSDLAVVDLKMLAFVSNQPDLLIYLGDQAKALEQWYAQKQDEPILAAALQVYHTGDALIDLIRQGQSGLSTKLFWREEVLPFYERAIGLCHRLGRGEEAFFFFEKSKSILLLEAMLENDALQLVPDSLASQEIRLQRALTNLQEQLPHLTEEERPAVFRRLLDTQRQLEALRIDLGARYPQYQEMKQALPVPAWADFARTCLQPARQTLVHYFFGRERVYALVLDEQGPRTYDLGHAAALRTSVGAVLAYFSEAATIQNAPAAYVAAAYRAYQQLVAPLGIAAGINLLIIPDGPLTYLPFSALTTNANYAGDLGKVAYLLRQNPLSYSYSASILARQAKRVWSGASGLVAFAPFTNGKAPVGYPTLSYSQDELKQISTYFQVRLLQDEEADLLHWHQIAPTARILHLSTHAFSSPEEQSPHIAFYDSLLYLPTLYRDRLNAALVVLSACQTNIGPLAPGEGVLGLGRGFVQAGASSIIASLWNVNARSTGNILADFYQQLARGQSKPKALWQAQLDYLVSGEVPHFQKSPYYWAGLTYYGDAQGLQLTRNRSFWGWLVGGGALALCLLYWFRQRKRD
jgi:CHAT domain-containing protein